MKSLLFSLAAIALSLMASVHRFGDSAHAMGLLSLDGGRVRHPVHLPIGRTRYTVVVTATALPPFRGDVKVELTGEPPPRYTLAATEAVIDLGLRRHPRFRSSSFFDVSPGDRFAFWVAIDGKGIAESRSFALRFSDRRSGRPLLTIPLRFGSSTEAPDAR